MGRLQLETIDNDHEKKCYVQGGQTITMITTLQIKINFIADER